MATDLDDALRLYRLQLRRVLDELRVDLRAIMSRALTAAELREQFRLFREELREQSDRDEERWREELRLDEARWQAEMREQRDQDEARR